MALHLCNACERHVRETDATCPYCGSTETVPVPAPTRINRKAMYFAAVVMTTAAVETVSCVAMYGASVDCEDEDCGFIWRCTSAPTPTVGQGELALPSSACTEANYRTLTDACVHDPTAFRCPSEARAHPDCARCLLGPRDLEPPALVSPGATLSLSPLIVNTGACAVATVGRPDCAAHVTRYDARVVGACSSCSDPGSLAACREAQRPTKARDERYGEQALECIDLRDRLRSAWEPACMGTTPEETLDKVAHVLCVGR